MWVKHFVHKFVTSRYKEFRTRYFEFRDSDCVELCRPHHEEIHQIYFGIIETYLGNKKQKPFWQWNWNEAEELMIALRETCDKWLKTKTPGATEFKLLR